MLTNRINHIIKNSSADIAVLVKDLKEDKVIFKYNEDKKYVSASVIKVPIMIEALSRVDLGEINLDDKFNIGDDNKVDFSVITEQDLKECTFEELIEWMIISSDNTATNVLIDILGLENINDRIKKLNMKNTLLERKMMDFKAIEYGRNNYTSLNDMLIAMEGLYRGVLISSEMSLKAIDILKNQRDNFMLKRYIRDNVTLANKTGELDKLNNDVGIFYTKNHNYFIGIFVYDVKKNKDAYEIIGKISKEVYDYYKNI
ncbi:MULTISPECIES: serine hydrolase [Clostridium]|uniref:Beta-lactamase n=1 Tax=Clostridium carnis TaxID=1530 RepID=A0ABY6SW50_9CLOT|nr:serine hydrolase [Clostridium carnis]CAI3548730.1 putative beta-lactamase/transpeptidase-like protein [Clostridium neonatale]CAI3572042.1 putative beta-lactamase/transpeptidase-like protein [Clostridium neonatale]CAI3596563.1 putative beta-lactamase/transpeptidase-like protein [Clostridium neonatale]CAI3606939.1 putative beta-lactamase/transpeptidase-like protein [Clostridium neonatale]CAI3706682.1 putative beta-lactamase/transpeptidase-like protein [Clostridium neonatale]